VINDGIDELLDSITRMIAAQDGMQQAERYSDYRESASIRDLQYLPAKRDARDNLRRVITGIVRQEIAKQPRAKTWGLF
jgi:hypothetical protein